MTQKKNAGGRYNDDDDDAWSSLANFFFLQGVQQLFKNM